MDSETVKGKPLTKEETKALLELIEASKIITNKTTNATSNKIKLDEWKKITDTFNATATITRRTPQQLRLKWENLKKNARKRSTRIRMNHIQTGGGVGDYIPPDEILERVTNLLGSTASGFQVPYGGDREPDGFVDGDGDGDGGGLDLLGGEARVNLEILDFEDAPISSAGNLVTVPSNSNLVMVPSCNSEVTVLHDYEKPKKLAFVNTPRSGKLKRPHVDNEVTVSSNVVMEQSSCSEVTVPSNVGVTVQDGSNRARPFLTPRSGKKRQMGDGAKIAKDFAIAEYFKLKKQCLGEKLKYLELANEKLKLENEKLRMELENMKK